MSEVAPLVLLIAGGTGGHIFPGLAVAKELQLMGYRVHWLGTPRGMEANIIPKEGINISFISVTGLRGKGLFFLLKAPWFLALSLMKAIFVIRQQKPVCVVGMGGYVTGPGGIAAKLLGIPLVIHEQNAVPGFTNRVLARISCQVLEAFPNTFAKHLRSKVYLTGNPVRSDIATTSSFTGCHSPLRLLVIGGSRGALFINQLIPQVLKNTADKVAIWHQTGKINFNDCCEAYRSCGVDGKIEPFIADMAKAYEWSDLVLCRAGALTVSELACVGRAAILIPYPYAVDDHQTVNANFLVSRGAALKFQEDDLSVEILTELLIELAADSVRLESMAAAAKSCGCFNATQDVVKHCLEAARVRMMHA